MPNKSSELTTPLKTDLLRFYDRFVEFNDDCSFMCDALVALAADEEYLDPNTAIGASRYCDWVKSRIKGLEKELKQIHEKAWAQGQT